MRLWCCECANHVEARLTDGREIYPHRPDLAALPFWRCDGCGGYVGTHHRSDDPTRPLGVIPSSALMSNAASIAAVSAKLVSADVVSGDVDVSAEVSK